MDYETIDLPREFVDLVRDALLHLYDPSYLQTHSLLAFAREANGTTVARGKRLYQALLDAIEALRPEAGVEPASRAWRAYRILELRYVDGRETSDVMSRVVLSKNQYHREHNRALQAVASILWERWQAGDRGPGPGAGPATIGQDPYTLAQLEVEQLLQDTGAGNVGRVDPAEALVGVGRLLAPLCERRGVLLRVEAPEPLPRVVGNRVALRQALLTVLAHAIGTSRDSSVEATAAVLERRVVVRIVGTLAEPESTSWPPTDESRPFFDALPGLACTSSLDQTTGVWEINLSFPTSDRAALLVVDNNADFVRLVERYLASCDWDVVGVADVDQATTLVLELQPRAILLDIVIPGRDGWDLLQTLKQVPSTREIPVIVCSVLNEPEVAMALGAAAYLQKPIDKQRLIGALGALC